jgi:hypothetical protein
VTEAQAAELLELMRTTSANVAAIRFLLSALGLGIGWIIGQYTWELMCIARKEHTLL